MYGGKGAPNMMQAVLTTKASTVLPIPCTVEPYVSVLACRFDTIPVAISAVLHSKACRTAQTPHCCMHS